MQISEIISALNEEISRLEQVRDLLSNETTSGQTGKRRGRPKGSVNKTRAAKEEKDQPSPKRQMSEAGRARIAAAQKKRWAVAKQADKPESSSARKSAGGKKAAKVGRPAKGSKKASASEKKSTRSRQTDQVKPEASEASQ